MDKIDTCRLVMQDIEARRMLGINTYGVPLAPHNGRNSLQDAYEECLDMAMYLKNEMLENGIKSDCGTNQDGVEKLSNRVRSNSEAAPWVIGEICNLESNLEAAVSEAIEQARLNGMGAEREAALMAKLESAERERDALRAKIAEMEKREPVGVMYVGSYYGYELPEWEFDADQCACDRLNEAYVNNPTTLKLYAIPDTKGE